MTSAVFDKVELASWVDRDEVTREQYENIRLVCVLGVLWHLCGLARTVEAMHYTVSFVGKSNKYFMRIKESVQNFLDFAENDSAEISYNSSKHIIEQHDTAAGIRPLRKTFVSSFSWPVSEFQAVPQVMSWALKSVGCYPTYFRSTSETFTDQTTNIEHSSTTDKVYTVLSKLVLSTSKCSRSWDVVRKEKLVSSFFEARHISVSGMLVFVMLDSFMEDVGHF